MRFFTVLDLISVSEVTIVRKAVTITATICILFLVMATLFAGVAFDKQVTQIPSDCEVFPAYMTLSGLHYNDTCIQPASICKSTNQQNTFKEVLLICNERIYITYTTEWQDGYSWHLAYIERNTLSITELCCLPNAQNPYRRSFDAPLSERSAFYYNDCIILTDGYSVVCYDLVNDSCKEYQHDTFKFPEHLYYGWTEDGITLCIRSSEELMSISVKNLVDSSDSVAKIVDLSQNHELYFCDGCVQYVNGRLFVIAEFRNPFGVPYGLIMLYDEQSQNWQYVTCCINWDTVEQQFYIVSTR